MADEIFRPTVFTIVALAVCSESKLKSSQQTGDTVNQDQADYLARGYAWGTEDTTRVATLGDDTVAGAHAFAVAFAAGWADYNAGRRGSMITVRDAYETWQASAGHSIFKAGQSTAELALAAANWRRASASGVDVTSPEYLRRFAADMYAARDQAV
jgi:hypothetical protein